MVSRFLALMTERPCTEMRKGTGGAGLVRVGVKSRVQPAIYQV